MSIQLESSWKVYESVKDWIKFSDAKAGAIIAFYGVSGGVLLINSHDNSELLFSNFFIFLSFLISVMFSSISLIYALIVVWPRLAEEHSDSLIYYNDIAKNFENDAHYSHEFLVTFSDEEQGMRQITKQNWVLSKIARKKYRWISWSMRALILSLISFFAFVIVSFINYRTV